jgi:hypothetical protein
MFNMPVFCYNGTNSTAKGEAMFRLWGKIRKNNRTIRDIVVSSEEAGLSKEERLHECIQKICYEFDLQRPMWLPKNQREYDKYHMAALSQDNFIETIHFDFLELELIDE